METEDSTAEKLELAAKLLGLIYALMSVLFLIWTLIPNHQKRLLGMRAMEAIRSSAERLASRTGAQAISLEARTGSENYLVPYGLSLLRDKAAVAYEKLRYTA